MAGGVHISDSEIWGISSTRDFPGSWVYRSSYIYKAGFHAFVSSVFFFDLNSFDTLVVTRYLFCSVGLLLALLTYLIGSQWGRSQGLLACFLLMFSTLYLSRGYRIRSDLLSGLFFYLAIYLSICGKSPRLFIATLLAMLVATPKALLLLFLCANLLWFEKRSVYLKKLGQLTAWMALACLLMLISQPVRNSLFGIFYYFGESFGGGGLDSHYMNRTDFIHVISFIKGNPILFFIMCVSLIPSWYRKSGLEWSWYKLAWLALVLIILFPNKRPFFLLTYLPIFCILASFFFIRAASTLRDLAGPAWSGVAELGLLFAIAYGGYVHFDLLSSRNSNHEQAILMDGLEKYLQRHYVAKYYDGFGVLPRYPFLSGFIGPGQSQSNLKHIERMMNEKPEVILYTGKLALMREQVKPFLRENYQHVGHDVWARQDLGLPPFKVSARSGFNRRFIFDGAF